MRVQVQVRGRRARRWITFGLIAFGAVFLVIGLVLAGTTISFLADAERARGTVVALEWRDDDHGMSHGKRTHDGPVAYPVVEFTSADGTPRTFRSSTGTNPPSYEKGDRVEVLYRAESPGDARIDGFASLWLLPLLFGGIGLVIAGVGTVMALVTRRRSRSAGPSPALGR
ncbi:DUF3592 domain-containing protein [Streptomyces echinatus]|uniref:DUF3592 domain-containing protein n=1 Tax=Streptomyces echinatus TaxID=67293 RepID=A0A7W9UPW2_9ACTN|nr:DUF3592 domain-containing protein [Streptomyces echinatus]MBB5926777.1 hypothetical protein [Streptomyces echinatus]